MQLFSTIDDLIEANLAGGTQNQTEIGQKMNEMQSRMEDLESEEGQDKEHRHFKYRYHTLKACYLKALGDEAGASRQEKLAKKYKKLDTTGLATIAVDVDEAKALAAKIAARPEGASSSTVDAEIQKTLEKIKKAGIIDDNVYENIESLLAEVRQTPSSFDDYVRVSAIRENFKRFMQEAILEFDDAQEAEEEQNSSKSQDDRKKKLGRKDIRKSFEEFDFLVCCEIDQNRLAFFQKILTLPGQVKEILFSNLLLTEENIKSRYRKLAHHFHPDKAKWIPEAHQSTAQDLMALINDCKDALLQSLASASAGSGEQTFYQEQGDNFWRLAMDYKYASKCAWGKLTLLLPEVLQSLSPDVLNASRIEKVIEAYEAYRACCRLADKNQDLQSQVRLRGSIALCLYAAGGHLEAQLYALGAVKLIFDKSQHLTEADLSQAKQILEKVQGRVLERDDAQTTSSSPTSTSQAFLGVGESSSALTTVQEGYSFTEKGKIKGAIDQDLTKIAKELVLKSDRSLVKYQAAQEDILRAETKAIRYKSAGRATVGAGVVGGGIGIAAATGSVAANVALIKAGTVTGLVLAGPIAGIIFGVGAIGLGVWGGRYLWQEGHTMMKEPEIRKKLNDIMRKSLACYDEGNLQGFLDELSKKYDQETQLLSLEGLISGFSLDTIIATLTKHGFRPDGIAYLFNLMGEALISGKVSIPGLTQNDLASRAIESFQRSLSEKLVESAAKLDERISEMRKKDLISMMKERGNMLGDFFMLRDEGYLAREHVKDAQKMPFKVRLEEMRNVAKLNEAIIRIVRGGEEELHKAQKLVKVVRDSIDQYGQFYAKPAGRLAAIEDFLWIVSGQPADNEVPTLAISSQPHSEENVDEGQHYLTYLNNKLAKASSFQEKVKIYNQRAAYYVKKAQKAAKVDHLESLQHWQAAQKDYTSALGLMDHDQKTSLGYARCLIGLSKYDQALRYLKQHPNINETSDFWIIASIAYRKQLDYTQAKEYILEALQRDRHKKEAIRENALIGKLQAKTITERLAEHQSTQIQCEGFYFDVRRNREKQYYTILSLDGGGVRGVLPALWLSEIEHRTRRPVAHLFNMLAGTSTGAIIAAGLSVPVPCIDVPEKEAVLSAYPPRYSAFEMVQLYREESSKIFTTSGWGWVPGFGLANDKYTDAGRSSMFEKYFGQAKLSQALTELAIPAVRGDNLTHSHLFSRYEAQRDPADNVMTRNILMATTAAPTFFPAYRIPEKGTFVDGAIQANNPAMAAYSEAIRYGIPQQKIFMLSMGAGTCIPDPLFPDLNCGQLFWAGNFPQLSLALQEGDTHRQMLSNLGGRYQRWQVWLEKPIQIDAYEKMDTLLELGRQHLEELYASEDNTMNKLLEFLEENQG